MEFDPLEDIDPFCDSTIERFLKAARYPSVKYAHDMVNEDSELKVLKVGSSLALGKVIGRNLRILVTLETIFKCFH